MKADGIGRDQPQAEQTECLSTVHRPASPEDWNCLSSSRSKRNRYHFSPRDGHDR
jgi:hypothetical protein